MTGVYIIGAAMTPLGRHIERSVKDLTRLAVDGALADAGCSLDQIEAAWFSNTRQGQMEGQNSIRGQCALHALGLGGVPIFNSENACASSSSGLVQAVAAIRAGWHDIVLVCGAEKMIFPDRKAEMFRAFLGGTDVHAMDETLARLAHLGDGIGPATPPTGERSFFMDVYASLARQHMKTFGTTIEQLAQAAAKNHHHSSMNPLSQYRQSMSREEVLDSPMIVWPLTRAMCAPLSDGAAAVVLCSEAALRRFSSHRAIHVAGVGVSSSGFREPTDFSKHCARAAATRAYEMAGVGPAEMDLAEVHDASAFAEILQVENLGFCATGEGGALTESGATALGGRIPVNPSGGLVSKGHLIAATGLVQLHELVIQLRGEAGARQVADARFAIAENGGGWVGVEEAACVVTVLERKT